MSSHNQRAILLRKRMKDKDELVDKILENPAGPEALLFKKAQEMNDNNTKKKYIEACLIACGDYQRIADLFELPVALVEIYAKVYYDVADADKLTKIELLDKARNQDELVLKTWALHQGIDFIAWRLGKKTQVDINPVDGLTDLFNSCIYKSKEALFNTNASSASIESTKWTKLAVEIARILKAWVMDSTSAQKEIGLDLQGIIPEFKSLDELKQEESSLDVSVDDKEDE